MSFLNILRQVMQNGVAQLFKANLNFVGAGFTVTPNSNLNSLDIALTGQTSGAVTTTTNATTAIVTFPLPASSTTVIYVEVTAHQLSGTSSPDGAEYQLKGAWRNDASVVQIKAPTVVDSNPNASGAAWTAVLLLSGTNVLVNVVGDTGKTVSWRASVTTYGGN